MMLPCELVKQIKHRHGDVEHVHVDQRPRGLAGDDLEAHAAPQDAHGPSRVRVQGDRGECARDVA